MTEASPQELAELEKYATLVFTSLRKSIINDLRNSKDESILYSKYKKNQVVKFLDDPVRNYKKIRELSIWLYYTSSHYRRLVDYFSEILLYNYYIAPTNIQTKTINEKKYLNAYYTVVNMCEKMNLKHECTKILATTVREGAFYGIAYGLSDDSPSCYIKPINAIYATVTSVEDGAWLFSLDLSYFRGREELLEMYESDVAKAFKKYKGTPGGKQWNKDYRYYEIQNSIVVLQDETDPYHPLPLFTGLLLSIFDIEDYRLLQLSNDELGAYKILAAQLPVDDDGHPKMDYDLARKYFKPVADSVPSGAGAVLSPFKMDAFSFQGDSSDTRDALHDAVDNFWEAAGESPLIFGSRKATSSAALLLSAKPDEAISFALLLQVQRSINRMIKKRSGLYHLFKIVFLEQSIFNQDEYTNRLAKAAQYSTPTKMMYMASIGLTPSDVIGMTFLEENILGLGTKVWTHPLLSSNTVSGTEEVGRPTNESQGIPLSEAGEQTKESGQNDNR